MSEERSDFEPPPRSPELAPDAPEEACAEKDPPYLLSGCAETLSIVVGLVGLGVRYTAEAEQTQNIGMAVFALAFLVGACIPLWRIYDRYDREQRSKR